MDGEPDDEMEEIPRVFTRAGFWPPPINGTAQLVNGDVVYSLEMQGLYAHFGVYDADADKIIHCDYAGLVTGAEYKQVECVRYTVQESSIRISCLGCFLGPGKQLRVAQFNMKKRHMFCKDLRFYSRKRSLDGAEVVRRAREALARAVRGKYGDWDYLYNCETFSTYCKTGEYRSKQVSALLIPVVAVCGNPLLAAPVTYYLTEKLLRHAVRKKEGWRNEIRV